MPSPTQLRSCSMRSAVQVAVELAVETAAFFGSGATTAGSTARALDPIGGIAGDERGSDGAIDGDMETASRLMPRPCWAADRAFVARSGNREKAKPRSENRCAALRADPEKSPRRDPKFSGWWRPVRRKDQPHQATTPHFTEPHPASRMADPPSEWRPYAATQSGPLLSPLSENSRRIEASHDSTRLPRVKMAL